MATVTRSGWTVDNPSQSSSIIRANVPTKFAGGLGTNVLVKSNISNGNYDVYQPSVFGDRLIYSRNASDNKLIIHDQSTYNEYFDKSRPLGQQNFNTLDKKIRIATYDQAQLNTGTDPVNNRNFEKIKASAAYKSLANIQTPGQRLPGADTPSPADGDAAATAAAQQAAAGTSITGTATDIAGGEKEAAKGRNTRGTYGNLVYPLDIKTTAQDVIRFKILKFKPTGLNISGALSGGATLGGNREKDKDNRDILGTIILPIPGNISDTNSCNWGDDKLDAFTAVAVNAAMDAIKIDLNAGADRLLQAGQGAAGAGNNDVKEAVAATIAKQAVGGGVNILGRTQGAVFNENLELLFSGPELRSFSFTFKMSARSKTEADEIVKIIRAFKQSMSAQTTKSSIFLKAPNTYEIEYLRRKKNGEGGTVHTRLGKIKECALLTLTTNYAPEGQYAVYNDGTPISYEIQMQLKELEPVFNTDYDDVTKDIGF